MCCILLSSCQHFCGILLCEYTTMHSSILLLSPTCVLPLFHSYYEHRDEEHSWVSRCAYASLSPRYTVKSHRSLVIPMFTFRDNVQVFLPLASDMFLLIQQLSTVKWHTNEVGLFLCVLSVYWPLIFFYEKPTEILRCFLFSIRLSFPYWLVGVIHVLWILLLCWLYGIISQDSVRKRSLTNYLNIGNVIYRTVN